MTNGIYYPGLRIGMLHVGNDLAGAFQDPVVEFTAVLKLNQGVPEIGRNRNFHFAAALQMKILICTSAASLTTLN
ncbi:MAG: hypothetical protein ACTHMM_23860 [Agriterribacter sp.]